MEFWSGFAVGFGIAAVLFYGVLTSGRAAYKELRKLADEQKAYIAELRKSQ